MSRNKEKEKEQEPERHCAYCDISSNEAVLFPFIAPPIVQIRTDTCRPCLHRLLDSEKKKNKDR